MERTIQLAESELLWDIMLTEEQPCRMCGELTSDEFFHCPACRAKLNSMPAVVTGQGDFQKRWPKGVEL